MKRVYRSLGLAAAASFLGGAPRWYKRALLAALLINPLLAWLAGPVPAAWALVAEFILTLALALRCHPLAPGGLLAIEALALGLARTDQAWGEIGGALPVLLLVLFMVAAIGLMRELLLRLFTRVLLAVRSTPLLSLLFLLGAALLSAFLDALTVIAVVIAIAQGLLAQQELAAGDAGDAGVPPAQAAQLQAALRGLVMHAAVGTAIGGVATLVGEPQNLLIGHALGWEFLAFARHMAPITALVLAGGVFVCLALGALRAFGYGVDIPADARVAIKAQVAVQRARRTTRARWRLFVQSVAAVLLVLALAMHWAEPGLVGLALVVLLAALQGVVHEERLAEALKEAVPFTALLAVFFVVVAVIQAQALFGPVVHWVLAQSGTQQLVAMYFANGLLSAVSDNVFVASIYLAELRHAVAAGSVGQAQLPHLALAINAGTNLPSIATPNGQAAFLYLLTSALAPRIGLSYARMCWMALPYLVVLTLAGLWGLTRLAG